MLQIESEKLHQCDAAKKLQKKTWAGRQVLWNNRNTWRWAVQVWNVKLPELNCHDYVTFQAKPCKMCVCACEREREGEGECVYLCVAPIDLQWMIKAWCPGDIFVALLNTFLSKTWSKHRDTLFLLTIILISWAEMMSHSAAVLSRPEYNSHDYSPLKKQLSYMFGMSSVVCILEETFLCCQTLETFFNNCSDFNKPFVLSTLHVS